MALFSNSLATIRHYLSNSVGDLVWGQCGIAGATPQKINAPFLWKPNDYYKKHFYEVYVYAGVNKGVTKRVIGWALTTFLLEVHSVYANTCTATSYIELHHIFSEDDYRKAINLAIENVAGKYLVDVKVESDDADVITLVAGTYEYELPLSMLYLHRVTTEHEVDGGKYYNSAIIDPRNYSIIKSYPPKLKLDKRYYPITADKDLRLEGQGTQPIVDDDTDDIYLPPDWLVRKAITFLPEVKVQSNNLVKTVANAYEWCERHPIVKGANPFAKRVVE